MTPPKGPSGPPAPRGHDPGPGPCPLHKTKPPFGANRSIGAFFLLCDAVAFGSLSPLKPPSPAGLWRGRPPPQAGPEGLCSDRRNWTQLGQGEQRAPCRARALSMKGRRSKRKLMGLRTRAGLIFTTNHPGELWSSEKLRSITFCSHLFGHFSVKTLSLCPLYRQSWCLLSVSFIYPIKSCGALAAPNAEHKSN